MDCYRAIWLHSPYNYCLILLLRARENPIPTPSLFYGYPNSWPPLVQVNDWIAATSCGLFILHNSQGGVCIVSHLAGGPAREPHLGVCFFKPLLEPISLGWFPRKQTLRWSLPRGSWLRSVFRTISVEEGRMRVVQKDGLNCDNHSISMDSHRSSTAGINLESRELDLYFCTSLSHCLVDVLWRGLDLEWDPYLHSSGRAIVLWSASWRHEQGRGSMGVLVLKSYHVIIRCLTDEEMSYFPLSHISCHVENIYLEIIFYFCSGFLGRRQAEMNSVRSPKSEPGIFFFFFFCG